MRKIMLLLLLVALAITLMGCSEIQTIETPTPTPTETPEQQVEDSSGVSIEGEYSKDELIRLLKRVLSSPYADYQPSYYPTELPETFPVDIPVPDDAEVIGSVVRGGNIDTQTAYLNVPGESEEVLEYYRNELNETDWVYKSRGDFYSSGFTPREIPDQVVFCRNESSGPALTVYTTQKEEDITDVRVSFYNRTDYHVCQEDRRGFMDREREIPRLEPPQDVDVIDTDRGAGAGTGEHGRHSIEDSKAVIKTEMSPVELEEHYRGQLKEEGWELQKKQEGEGLVYSIYNFTDDQNNQWRATLTVQVMEEDTRVVYLTALTWN